MKSRSNLMNTEAQNKSNQRGGSILLWIFFTVISFHMVLFLFSCTMLLTQAKSVESSFADGALKDHGIYLIFGTLALLRGYLLVSICYVVVLFPIIKLWLGQKEPKKIAIVWRTLLLMLVSIMAFFIRMMVSKPYFLWRNGCLNGNLKFCLMHRAHLKQSLCGHY